MNILLINLMVFYRSILTYVWAEKGALITFVIFFKYLKGKKYELLEEVRDENC